jgi:putative ATP-dependent endonuclease of OLD family
MAIKKVKIENFKIYNGVFELGFNPRLNILVGDNEVGKSTILEAIHLALTGIINGKYLNTELTQYLFNNAVVKSYIDSLSTTEPQKPPQIKIELYFDSEDERCASFMGNDNSDKDVGACGLSFIISFDDKYAEEYSALLDLGDVKTLPIEYYEAKWATFGRKDITTKSIPIKSVLVDSTSTRYQNGSDFYITRIVRQVLETTDVVKIAQAHRRMRENFMQDQSVKNINQKIETAACITDKRIELSVELLSKNAWETSLVTYLDEVPFQYIGKGEQCMVKTRLALSDKRATNAMIILMEEPENHLTYCRLNKLLNIVKKEYSDKQVIISTHSSFVANKLGLTNLTCLSSGTKMKLSEIDEDTQVFFEKLPGYDTLRLVLSQKAILVEGASDELVIQKAYMRTHEERLPIEDGIDVISVGTAFLRFLEVARILKKRVAVVTDNDGDIDALKNKYEEYLNSNVNEEPESNRIFISYDEVIRSEGKLTNYNYNTLENLMLLANGLKTLNSVFNKDYGTEDDLRKYMRNNKTDCALAIFKWPNEIDFPDYINKAIQYVS